MGLIRALKRIFNHNIQCGQSLEDELLYLYPSRSRVIRLGYNIIVKAGCCVVFVVKGKVTDVLSEGKYKLSWSILQATYRRLKLDHHEKKKNSFKADLYFVNQKSFNDFVFESNQPFIIKTETFGKVVANVGGVCTLKINQPNLLLQTLLMDRAYIKNKTAKKFVSYYIGNEIAQMLEKGKTHFNEMICETKVANNYLNEVMIDALFGIGLKISNVRMNCISCLNKKQQNKINEYLSYQSEYRYSCNNVATEVPISVNVDSDINLSNSNHNESSVETYVNLFHNNSSATLKICSKCNTASHGNYCNNCGAKLN